MLIHLMQHGTCLSKEIDPHQPLSPVGREQIEKSAKAARVLGLRFELIVASPKLRSIQTAEIMAQHTRYPLSRIMISDTVTAMAPVQTALDFIREYDGLDSILVTGHLPSLANIASFLLTPGKTVDITIENGGLMQLAFLPGKSRASLNWYITPSQLAHIAKS